VAAFPAMLSLVPFSWATALDVTDEIDRTRDAAMLRVVFTQVRRPAALIWPEHLGRQVLAALEREAM